jgi:phosphatidylglycerophosphatase A
MILAMSDPAASGATSSRFVGACATVLATGFGSGYAPFAPGTAGSALGLLLFWPLQRLPLSEQALVTAALFLVGVAAATHVARRVGIEDPSIVVWDEVIGMWVSLMALPFRPLTMALGFVLFRIMDVVKPYPARDLERLPGGWGIMADDVMAGIYANLVLRVGLLVWPLG